MQYQLKRTKHQELEEGAWSKKILAFACALDAGLSESLKIRRGRHGPAHLALTALVYSIKLHNCNLVTDTWWPELLELHKNYHASFCSRETDTSFDMQMSQFLVANSKKPT